MSLYLHGGVFMKLISRCCIVLACCFTALSSYSDPHEGYSIQPVHYNDVYNPYYSNYNPYYSNGYTYHIGLPWVSQVILIQLALAQRQFCANQYYSCVVSSYQVNPYVLFQPLPTGAICTNQYFYCTGYW